jgi:uncharacterized membrane protein
MIIINHHHHCYHYHSCSSITAVTSTIAFFLTQIVVFAFLRCKEEMPYNKRKEARHPHPHPATLMYVCFFVSTTSSIGIILPHQQSPTKYTQHRVCSTCCSDRISSKGNHHCHSNNIIMKDDRKSDSTAQHQDA